MLPEVMLILAGGDQPTLIWRRNTLLDIITLAELSEPGPFASFFWSPNLDSPVDLVRQRPRPGHEPLELDPSSELRRPWATGATPLVVAVRQGAAREAAPGEDVARQGDGTTSPPAAWDRVRVPSALTL